MKKFHLIIIFVVIFVILTVGILLGLFIEPSPVAPVIRPFPVAPATSEDYVEPKYLKDFIFFKTALEPLSAPANFDCLKTAFQSYNPDFGPFGNLEQFFASDDGKKAMKDTIPFMLKFSLREVQIPITDSFYLTGEDHLSLVSQIFFGFFSGIAPGKDFTIEKIKAVINFFESQRLAETYERVEIKKEILNNAVSTEGTGNFAGISRRISKSRKIPESVCSFQEKREEIGGGLGRFSDEWSEYMFNDVKCIKDLAFNMCPQYYPLYVFSPNLEVNQRITLFSKSVPCKKVSDKYLSSSKGGGKSDIVY